MNNKIFNRPTNLTAIAESSSIKNVEANELKVEDDVIENQAQDSKNGLGKAKRDENLQEEISLIESQANYIAKESKKNRWWIRAIDGVQNGFTWLFSGITLMSILAIFIFVFMNGWKNLNWSFFSGNYFPTQVNFHTTDNYINTGSETFVYPGEKPNEVFFSSRWGVAFVDTTGNAGRRFVGISYIDPDSPLNRNVVNSNNEVTSVQAGWNVSSMMVLNDNGDFEVLGTGTTSNLPEGITYYAEWFAVTMDQANQIIDGQLSQGGDGFRGSFITTIYMILTTLMVALPLGIGGAIYLSIYAKKNKATGFVRGTIDLLSGIPSIIYGLIGALVFIPLFNGGGRTGSLWSGAFTLAIMVLPLIVKNTEEAIKVIPSSLSQASLGLGASQSQTVFKIIIPNATSGILTGTILAIGRIIGESASLIFAVGSSIQDNIALDKPSATLAVHIWTLMSGQVPNFEAASTIAIVILFMVLILNTILSIVSHKLNKFDARPSKTWIGQGFDKIKKLVARKGVKENA